MSCPLISRRSDGGRTLFMAVALIKLRLIVRGVIASQLPFSLSNTQTSASIELGS